jgi:hypothetical protein
MSSVEPSALWLLRNCCRREFGDRERGEVRLLEAAWGEGRYREKPKGEDVVALGLRLNDILPGINKESSA